MTTICAVRKSSRIAIACDTCTSCGASVDRAGYVVNHSKILSIGEVHIFGTANNRSARRAVSLLPCELASSQGRVKMRAAGR